MAGASISAWKDLSAQAARLHDTHLVELFARDVDRTEHLSLRLGAIYADFAKQRVDKAAIAALIELAHSAGLEAAIADFFNGVAVNRSENRPALHTALRAANTTAPADSVTGRAIAEAATVRARMRKLSDAWRAQGTPEAPVEVIHVGIGGSDLGPRLACEALSEYADGRVRVHFVANVDGLAVARLRNALDPARTRVCLVSKSFTTQETLLNGGALRQWLSDALGEAAARERMIAITANTAAARAYGIADDAILPMWDWVGGRYSLWSAVGLPVALTCGMDIFERMLEGARLMDEHYRREPFARNIAVMTALVGIWNRNALGFPTLAVIAYDDRLRLLPSFLQQLEMESNGKGVRETGEPLHAAVAPVLWGEVGSNAQHAFFQALHQSPDVVPVDFIGVARPAHGLADNHDALLANLLAQSSAMMHGTDAAHETDPALRAQKACPGNQPSTTYLLDELTPEAFGELIAMYEHKVHAQGRIWGVNSFDQWGVELGKVIARSLLPAVVEPKVAASLSLDASTRGLLEQIHGLRRG